MLGLMLLTGCGGLLPFPSATPKSIQPGDGTVAHALEYELLEQTSAKACSNIAELAVIHGPRQVDKMSVGHPALFERAKFEAITKVKGADGLAGVSAKVELEGAQECVTVIGRAFAIRAIYDVVPATTPRPEARHGHTREPDLIAPGPGVE
jgi:hypothetical protein